MQQCHKLWFSFMVPFFYNKVQNGIEHEGVQPSECECLTYSTMLGASYTAGKPTAIQQLYSNYTATIQLYSNCSSRHKMKIIHAWL